MFFRNSIDDESTAISSARHDNLEREFEIRSRNDDSVWHTILPPISTQTEENDPSLSNEQTPSTPVTAPQVIVDRMASQGIENEDELRDIR